MIISENINFLVRWTDEDGDTQLAVVEDGGEAIRHLVTEVQTNGGNITCITEKRAYSILRTDLMEIANNELKR